MVRESKFFGWAIAVTLGLALAIVSPVATQAAATATINDGECVTVSNHDPCKSGDCYLSIDSSLAVCVAVKCATNNGWTVPVNHKWCRHKGTGSTCSVTTSNDKVVCTLSCNNWECDYPSTRCKTNKPNSANSCRCTGQNDGTTKTIRAYTICT